MKTIAYENGADLTFKLTVILNYRVIYDLLAGTVVDFWELIKAGPPAALLLLWPNILRA